MRNFGFVLLVAGCLGFYHCSERMSAFEPLPESYSVQDSLHTERGKWEAGRYACAAAAFIGLLFVFAPQGR